MPILAEETTLFPETLFEDFSAERYGPCWWAIYTKARQEKALARDLLRYEVPFFLPLVPKENFIRGKRIQSHIPLFTGYLFMCGMDEQRVRALTTNRISRILPVANQQELCRELGQVHVLIESNAPLTIESRLKPGRRVRVKSGSMMGVEGVVTERRRVSRLLVAVNLMQQGVSIEIDDFMLESID